MHMRSVSEARNLRIGTRGSPLALAHTAAVCQLLAKVYGLARGDIEVKVIKTTGDLIQNRPLAEIGGKDIFTKEIEIALAAGEIDFAVHSAKDMPTALLEGLAISASLKREDVRDALVSRDEKTLAKMPRGASLGTASLRREAQVRRLRPDIDVRPLRGDVHTRLRKVEDGEIDATILGMAGLNRLGLTAAVTQVLPIDDFLPAVGQGAVAIETREDDDKTRELLAAINHAPTAIAVTAERAFLAVLDGSCRTPIAGHAVVSETGIEFRGMILQPDSAAAYEVRRTGMINDPNRLGAEVGADLKSRVAAGFMAQAV
jgi:hydroxymethylbilane synthase